MDAGRLLLRTTVGAIFVEHGTQKLFGWFGGHGPDGTGQFFESIGLRPGRSNAIAAGITEAAGGLLLTLGLATPLAAASLASVMMTALRTAVWRDGFRTGTGGYEMLLLASAVALAESGPGPWSLDRLLGSERRGTGWALAALTAAAAGSAAATALGRRQPGPAGDEAEPSADEAGAATAPAVG
ncbi:MAG TPA: DoxX family protein [Gaiellaceae bacterium]|nr:DoxX family protein [Gaiellaceae bacterium]